MMVGVYRGQDKGSATERVTIDLGSSIYYLSVADAHWLMNRLRASIAAVKKVEASK